MKIREVLSGLREGDPGLAEPKPTDPRRRRTPALARPQGDLVAFNRWRLADRPDSDDPVWEIFDALLQWLDDGRPAATISIVYYRDGSVTVERR